MKRQGNSTRSLFCIEDFLVEPVRRLYDATFRLMRNNVMESNTMKNICPRKTAYNDACSISEDHHLSFS